jgi:hypothetical protein
MHQTGQLKDSSRRRQLKSGIDYSRRNNWDNEIVNCVSVDNSVQ